MLSGRFMLVSSQCHCNSLKVRPNRSGGDTDCGNEMLNLAKPYSEAAKTPQALPKLLLEIPIVPAGTSGITVTGQPVFRNSDNASGDISLDRTGSVITRAVAATPCNLGLIPTLIMSDRRLPNRGERWT